MVDEVVSDSTCVADLGPEFQVRFDAVPEGGVRDCGYITGKLGCGEYDA